MPVRVRKSALDGVLWQSINIREELWHRDRPEGDMARLRGVPEDLPPDLKAKAQSKEGLILPDWGHPASLLWKTGKLGMMSPALPLEQQAAFLRQSQPAYLFTFPSHLRLLIGHFRDTSKKLTSLRSVWTSSEQVSEELREECAKVFNCKIVDNYTSGETGYVALQCPQANHFHVQSEVVLVEVLNENGGPCRPGEIGKVALTPLHNFSMPLLRYEIGDEAKVGEPCACGRTLPVLKRIVGRAEDHIILENGERRRVDLRHYRLSTIKAVREFRLVQRSFSLLELQLVVARALTPQELAAVEEVAKTAAKGLLETKVTFVDKLERTQSGKLRAFVREVGKGDASAR